MILFIYIYIKENKKFQGVAQCKSPRISRHQIDVHCTYVKYKTADRCHLQSRFRCFRSFIAWTSHPGCDLYGPWACLLNMKSLFLVSVFALFYVIFPIEIFIISMSQYIDFFSNTCIIIRDM